LPEGTHIQHYFHDQFSQLPTTNPSNQTKGRLSNCRAQK
jgi:hypothetical protein